MIACVRILPEEDSTVTGKYSSVLKKNHGTVYSTYTRQETTQQL